MQVISKGSSLATSRASAPRSSVRVVAFKGDPQKDVAKSAPSKAAVLKDTATLPNVPITLRYPPPRDLEQIIRNPGEARAYASPDRFHPEIDKEPPAFDLTVLQQHVAPFDYDQDGIIWPVDTFRGFKDIGYPLWVSLLAPMFIHSGMSLPTQEGFPNLLFPIYIKNIHKCKHGGSSLVYDNEGRFVPQKFEEIFSKFDKDNKGGLTYAEIREMCRENSNLFDGFGRIATFMEWTVTYFGFKDENGVLTREAIRKQFDGSLWREYMRKKGSSMREKKGHK